MKIPKYDLSRMLDYVFDIYNFNDDTFVIYEVDEHDDLCNIFKDVKYIVTDTNILTTNVQVVDKRATLRPTKRQEFIGQYVYENVPDYYIFVACDSKDYNLIFNGKSGDCIYAKDCVNNHKYYLRLCKYSRYDYQNGKTRMMRGFVGEHDNI